MNSYCGYAGSDVAAYSERFRHTRHITIKKTSYKCRHPVLTDWLPTGIMKLFTYLPNDVVAHLAFVEGHVDCDNTC